MDSDAIYFPPGGGFKLVELAPNVQHVVGGSANNLIVAMARASSIFDAPVNEGQSRWVIDAAKKKYPGKPISHLVLTHHHMDHTGGMRTYVAEGATVIVPAPTKAYFEQVAKAPHAVSPDALQKQPRPANIVEVAETMTLKDDTDPDQPAQHPEPAFGRDADRPCGAGESGVGHRPDLAARAARAQSRDGCGRRCLAQAQHHRRDVRRRPRHHRQAIGLDGSAKS